MVHLVGHVDSFLHLGVTLAYARFSFAPLSVYLLVREMLDTIFCFYYYFTEV